MPAHTIAAPPNDGTFTANFSTEHLLTTSVSPSSGGTVTSGGMFSAGASVTVAATPAAGFRFVGYSGDLSGATNPQTIVVDGPRNVTANFEPTVPVAQNGMVTTLEDTPVSGILSATDPGGGVLVYTLVTSGTSGTAVVTDPATGAFTYAPSANANGADAFSFRVNNGTADSNVAIVTVAITAVNDAPVATGGSRPRIKA